MSDSISRRKVIISTSIAFFAGCTSIVTDGEKSNTNEIKEYDYCPEDVNKIGGPICTIIEADDPKSITDSETYQDGRLKVRIIINQKAKIPQEYNIDIVTESSASESEKYTTVVAWIKIEEIVSLSKQKYVFKINMYRDSKPFPQPD